MLCLPPNTTQKSQLLEFGVFGALKSQCSNVCHRFFQENPGKVIMKIHFSALFLQARARAISPSNIIAGFQTCGVYPFNPAAIKVPEANAGAGASVVKLHPFQIKSASWLSHIWSLLQLFTWVLRWTAGTVSEMLWRGVQHIQWPWVRLMASAAPPCILTCGSVFTHPICRAEWLHVSNRPFSFNFSGGPTCECWTSYWWSLVVMYCSQMAVLSRFPLSSVLQSPDQLLSVVTSSLRHQFPYIQVPCLSYHFHAHCSKSSAMCTPPHQCRLFGTTWGKGMPKTAGHRAVWAEEKGTRCEESHERTNVKAKSRRKSKEDRRKGQEEGRQKGQEDKGCSREDSQEDVEKMTREKLTAEKTTSREASGEPVP